MCECVCVCLQIPCHTNSLQSAYQDTKSFCVPEIGLKFLPSIQCIPEVVKYFIESFLPKIIVLTLNKNGHN